MIKERIPRDDRIGIDLDTKNMFQLLKTYYNMKHLTNIVQVFETKHGFHILGYFPNIQLDKSMHIRNMLNDCSGRIDLDQQRMLHEFEQTFLDVLFYKKRDLNVKMSEDEYKIETQPFWGNGEGWKKHGNKEL
jgi:hypothetical protein